MRSYSPLQGARLEYQPKLPHQLQNLKNLIVKYKEIKSSTNHPSDPLTAAFPKTHDQSFITFAQGEKSHPILRVGVLFSGGQAAGGHNVVTGLYDALKQLNHESHLIGFLNGPKGLMTQEYIEITGELLESYRNQGGFDLLGSGRDKIVTYEQFSACGNCAINLNLDGIVIIGGDDSNTNAALLAEYFLGVGIETRVIGVPKTIDGDLKNEHIEISFGFDTACKTYSEIIGNLLRDALSAKKYYFFVKMMGRTASHVTLECALQTHPNMALIGEEIANEKKTLAQVTKEIADMICERSAEGKDYGLILIPEGILEFIPECQKLIAELNTALHGQEGTKTPAEVLPRLSPASQACYTLLPKDLQEQLLLDRDAHGNVKVSQIETEKLFIQLVQAELKVRQKEGAYSGKFSPQPLFLGYEGRSALPSNFDCQYCYGLGHVAALLIDNKVTGYMCGLQDVFSAVEEWKPIGIPLVSMMEMELRNEKMVPVIKKALVNLNGKIFTIFSDLRAQWALEDRYLYPGPIQFFGPTNLTDRTTLTLLYETEERRSFSN